jgi:hypothetical protein
VGPADHAQRLILEGFGSWLLKDALPVLLEAAPIILPLLWQQPLIVLNDKRRNRSCIRLQLSDLPDPSWWMVSHEYIRDERQRTNDRTAFTDYFEVLVQIFRQMDAQQHLPEPTLSELQDFLTDESNLD